MKTSLEKQLKSSLADAQAYLNNCIMELNEIETLKERQKKAYCHGTAYKTPYDFKTFSSFYGELEQKRLGQLVKIKEAEQQVEIVRKQLIEVTEEKKKFEKLKENQFNDYLYELKQEQEKETDDVLTYKITMA